MKSRDSDTLQEPAQIISGEDDALELGGAVDDAGTLASDDDALCIEGGEACDAAGGMLVEPWLGSGRGRVLQAQSRVVLRNISQALLRLGRKMLRSLASWLGVPVGCTGTAERPLAAWNRTLRFRVAAALSGAAAISVESAWCDGSKGKFEKGGAGDRVVSEVARRDRRAAAPNGRQL